MEIFFCRSCILRIGKSYGPSNYRPISSFFLSIFDKILDALIKELVKHLTSCGFLSDKKYGFASLGQTLITVISNIICQALDKKVNARAVALDISRTFDIVWHASLRHKLKGYHVSSQIFDCIQR